MKPERIHNKEEYCRDLVVKLLSVCFLDFSSILRRVPVTIVATRDTMLEAIHSLGGIVTFVVDMIAFNFH